MLKTPLIFIFMTLVAVGCAPESRPVENQMSEADTRAIIGGKEAALRSPLQNQVLSFKSHLSSGNRFQCSAVALSRTVVLTAAHCWSFDPGADHFVEIPNENGEFVSIPVKYKIINQAYFLGKKEIDLMLVSLVHPLPKNIIPSELPFSENTIVPRYIYAAGYGKDNGSLSWEGGVGVLRTVVLKVLNYNSRHREFLVEQGFNKGFCQGDSGGPGFAVYKGKSYVVGVISRVQGIEQGLNPDKNVCDHRGYLTKTGPYLQWIYKTKKLLESGQRIEKTILEKILK